MANIVEFIYKLTDQVSGTLKKVSENSVRVQNKMDKTQSKVDKLGQSIIKLGAAYFGIQQTIRGGKAFIQLGMDMEQTRAKFEVLLGSIERGNKMIADIQNMSKITPFDQNTLTKNTETLLGFGVEADKVIDILNMLGNISMGNKERMGSLTLAFAQMSATGRLTGQDLLQMVNAGFNPLSEISRKTGISLVKLKDAMSDGKISAQMVEDAFRSATSEGGKFYGMMEKMAETGQGKLVKMLGIFRDRLIELSEKLSPVISRIADFGITVANNFENILAVISALLLPVRVLFNGLTSIGQFAIEYKRAFIAITIALVGLKLALWNATLATKGWTIASMLQYKWLLLVEKAQKLFNATIVKNPLGALLFGITAVVGVLVTLRKRTKEATDEISKLNKLSKQYAVEERANLDLIFIALRKTNPQSEERNKIIKQLQDMYPKVLENMNLEKAGLEDIERAYTAIIAAIDLKARKQAVENLRQEEYNKLPEIDFAIEDKTVEVAQNKELYEGIKDETLVSQTQIEYRTKYKNDYERSQKELKKLEADRNKVLKSIEKYNKWAEENGVLEDIINVQNLSPKNSSTDISSLTGSGSKPTNINITFRNLIEFLNMYPQTLKEGVNEISDELIEGLLRVVNSANKIAVR